jgi:Flp pilus assembly protein TadD
MYAETNGRRGTGSRVTRGGRFAAIVAVVTVSCVVLAAGTVVFGKSPARTASLRIAGAMAGSFVLVDGVRLGRTDPSGSRTFANIPPGRRTVVVRQPGSIDDRRVVVFRAGAAASVRPKRLALTVEAERRFRAGEFLAADGKHEPAAVEFRAALEARKGSYRDAEIGLARSLLALKDYEAAANVAEAVATANPKDVESRTVLANILRERGFYDEASDSYRQAIRLAPDRSPEAHAGLAILLGDRGDLPGSAVEYAKAIAQNLDAEPILYQLYGSVLERLERRADAVAAYERFLELAPTSSLAPAVRSVVEQLKGDEDVNPYAPAP